MAVIRDMISGFELFQPTAVDDAIELLSRYGDDGWVLSGGLDSFDWFKDRIKKPTAVVDLANVEELKGVRISSDGVEIGAMTTITEVSKHPHLLENYSILAQAAGHIATPQIRNRGTLGGNLSQDTRCWYYRSGWPCYRAGGNVCYAGTPTSMNREHCITGASRCVAVNPSDSAPALIALGAQFVIRGPRGEKIVEAQDYFMSPAVDIQRMTVLKPDELLTSIRIPATWSGTDFYYEKMEDRKAWDFALVSVASAIKINGGVIEDARLAVNGIAPFPVRLEVVESFIKGKEPTDELGMAAGQLSLSTINAQPLRHNGFKLPLMRNLVRRSIRGTEG